MCPPPARDRQADRRRARNDEGRRHEARPGDVLPRRRPRARGASRGVPGRARQAPRRRAHGLLQADAAGRSRRTSKSRSQEVFASSTRSRSPPPRSGRSTGARLAEDGREVAVKVQYPGVAGAVRADMQNLGHDHGAAQADDARHGRQGGHRGDPRADRGGARLRARGPEPALARADLRRAPLHRRARGGQLALARARARERVRRRRRLRGARRAARRASATASARSSSASSSAASTATVSSPGTRTPATSSCSRTVASRSWTSACSSAWTPPRSSSSSPASAP